YIMLIIGATIAAAAIELFLVDNSIIVCGSIGVALLLNHITNINFGILIYIINLPYLVFGYKYIGITFSFASLFGIIVLAIIERNLQRFEVFTTEPLLATVFGGLLFGTNVGMVIRYGDALDGTEILSIMLTIKIPFSVGEIVMFF